MVTTKSEVIIGIIFDLLAKKKVDSLFEMGFYNVTFNRGNSLCQANEEDVKLDMSEFQLFHANNNAEFYKLERNNLEIVICRDIPTEQHPLDIARSGKPDHTTAGVV